MTQMTITIDDASKVSTIRKLLKMIDGVNILPTPRKKKKSGLEEALKDVKTGRVTRYQSVDDFFKEMGH